MCIDLIQNSTDSVQLLLAGNREHLRRWDSMVDSALTPDVYYRPAYVRIHQIVGHGSAVALQVNAGRAQALFPLLLRPIAELGFAVELNGFDAITAYGYGGLLLLNGIDQPDAMQTRAILCELRKWCGENGIVSILVRLHPIMQQLKWLQTALDAECSLHHFGPTTALNTSFWNESNRIVTTLSKGRRSDLNFARRSLDVSWSSERNRTKEDLHIFYNLYERRMDQLHAGQFYHFPWEYYFAMAEELGDSMDVALVWLGAQPIAGAVFMADRRFAHYHLSASNELGRIHKATTLILNEAVDWARKRNCQYLHLGGGATGEDNLFAFKKSFQGEFFDFGLLRIVCDRKRYDALLQRRIAEHDFPPIRPNFFPEYRA